MIPGDKVAKKTLTKILTIFTFLTQSSFVFAQGTVSRGVTGCETAINCTVTTGNTTTATTTTNTAGTATIRPMSGATTTTVTTNYGSAGAADSGAYSQAEEAKNQSNLMMIAAAGLGTMYASRCGSRNPRACMLAAAAFSAAGLANQKSQQASGLMSSLGNGGQSDGTVDSAGINSTVATSLNKIKADLASNGFAVDESGNITMPNGSTVGGDLSEQSLKNAGMDASEANQLQKDLEAMRKEMRDKTGAEGAALLARDSGSTGYGRISISSLDGNEKEMTAQLEAERSGIDRDPASWTGFYKKFGDGLIGVSQSDIFLMVEKRVEKESLGMEQVK